VRSALSIVKYPVWKAKALGVKRPISIAFERSEIVLFLSKKLKYTLFFFNKKSGRA
jgi:hypothetical protein